jgi:hypothetical protein
MPRPRSRKHSSVRHHRSRAAEAVGGAASENYKQYKAAPENWKNGFVAGISRYMSTVAQPDEEPPYPVRAAFQRCFAAATDAHLVHQVDAYVAANPASSNGPVVTVVTRAMFDLRRSEIAKAQRTALPR